MKEAEKIIKCSESWFNEDQESRTAVVILADNKEGGVWGLSKGKTHKIGHFIHTLMTENKDLGHDIYVAACLYAHKHITAEERDKIDAFISADAEAHKKPKGGEE